MAPERPQEKFKQLLQPVRATYSYKNGYTYVAHQGAQKCIVTSMSKKLLFWRPYHTTKRVKVGMQIGTGECI